MSDLQEWLKSGDYLPEFMRDFHDQKDLFKAIHELVNDHDGTKKINWVEAHIYTVDVFLWFMARRGYTLQRSRKQVEFVSLDETIKRCNEARSAAFFAAMTNIKKDGGNG